MSLDTSLGRLYGYPLNSPGRRLDLCVGALLAVALLLLIVPGRAVSAADETLSLRSTVNAKLVRGGVGSQSLLAAVSDRIGGWERFVVVDLGGGKVALRSSQSGKYVRAGVGGQGLLAAVSDAVGGWETFRMVQLAEGRVALQSVRNGKYVRAGVGQQSFLAAVSPAIGGWETFTLVRMQGVLPMLPKLVKPDLKTLPEAQPPRAATRPAQQAPPVSPEPQPGSGAVDVNRWLSANVPVLNQSMNRLSQALDAAHKRRYGDVRLNLQALMQPPRTALDLMQDRAIADQLGTGTLTLKKDGLQTGKPEVSGIYVPPKIESVIYLPQKEALEPDIYVVIRGSGFGVEPGVVKLAYQTGSGELQEGKTDRQVDLLPLNGSWERAWLDHQIAVRVPSYIPGGEHMGGTISARLLVIRKNGAVAERTVALQGGTFPVITAVKSDRGQIGCCCPADTEIWSALHGTHDYVYWPQPTATYSWQTPCGLEKKDWLVPGGTLVIHGRRFGSTPGRLSLRVGDKPIPGFSGVRLLVPHGGWSDTQIRVQVENVPITGYFQVRPAWIELETAYGRANPRPVAFGPEMDAKWVSGRRWLEAGMRNDYKSVVETPDRSAMMVTHAPVCGWQKLGKEENEKGVDYFFEEPDAPYPQDVRITWVRFEQIDPADPSNEWSLFGPEIWDLVNVVFDPSSLVTFGLKTLVKGIALSGEGGYHAYPPHPPRNPKDPRTPEDKRKEPFFVKWETSCAINDGKPVVYFMAFMIEGPPAVLARY